MTETLVESTTQLSLSQEDTINKDTEKTHINDVDEVDDDANGENTTIHPLEYEWTFWYDKRPAQGKRLKGEQESYESNLRAIGTFGTVSFTFCCSGIVHFIIYYLLLYFFDLQ